jgi:hypothetical protein
VDREIAVAEARLADLPLVPGCRSQQLLIGDGNVLSTRQKFAGSVRGFNWVTWGASMSLILWAVVLDFTVQTPLVGSPPERSCVKADPFENEPSSALCDKTFGAMSWYGVSSP